MRGCKNKTLCSIVAPEQLFRSDSTQATIFSRIVINEKKLYRKVMITFLWLLRYQHCHSSECFHRQRNIVETLRKHSTSESSGRRKLFDLKIQCYFSSSLTTVSIAFSIWSWSSFENLQNLIFRPIKKSYAIRVGRCSWIKSVKKVISRNAPVKSVL